MNLKYLLTKKFCQKKDYKKRFSPIRIFKKNGVYYISIKEITERYKFIGVLFDRKIRQQNPHILNNVCAFGVL